MESNSTSQLQQFLNSILIEKSGKCSSKTLSLFDVAPQLEKIFRPNETSREQTPIYSTILDGEGDIIRGLTCRICSLSFEDVLQQRDHFKSEAHRRTISSTISGDEISENEEEDSSDLENEDNVGINEPIDEFVPEQTISDSTSSLGTVEKVYSPQIGPQLCFFPSTSQFKFSINPVIIMLMKARFEASSSFQETSFDPWKLFHASCLEIQQRPIWGIFLLRSGKFAGGIFEGKQCIAHKIFRRYTVRAKAGGSQSSYDNKGKKAQSMGATLRRYGEQHLKEDIQALLGDWASFVNDASLLLISCPRTLSHVFFSEKENTYLSSSSSSSSPSERDQRDVLFRKNDPRIVRVPGMVGVPTFEEVKAVHLRCSSITFSSPPPPPHPSPSASPESTPSSSTIERNETETERDRERKDEEVEELLERKDSKYQSSPSSSSSPPSSLLSAPTPSVCSLSPPPLHLLYLSLCLVCRRGDYNSAKSILSETKQFIRDLELEKEMALLSTEGESGCVSEDQDKQRGSEQNEEEEEEEEEEEYEEEEMEEETEKGDSDRANRVPNVTSRLSRRKNQFFSQLLNFPFQSESLLVYSPSTTSTSSSSPSISFLPPPHPHEEFFTPLHFASASGNPRLVTLLLRCGADPTREDLRARVPYFVVNWYSTSSLFISDPSHTADLSTDSLTIPTPQPNIQTPSSLPLSKREKDIREAFRRYRGRHEGKWDWEAARVPLGITEEGEKIKKQKEKEKKKRAQEKKKMQQQQQKRLQEESERKEQEKNLDIEKERFQNSTEKNSKKNEMNGKPQGVECAGGCGSFILLSRSLDVFGFKCCSDGCILKVRRKISAEAAEKRFKMTN